MTRQHAGRQYLVSEFVDGGTLTKDWRGRSRTTGGRAIELLLGVADGLAAAHAAGILHRDIKPANILMRRNGYAKLADFGLAKLAGRCGAGDAHSEPVCTRPESSSARSTTCRPNNCGTALDRRSDMFSFGVILYELLAGRRPFAGATTRHAEGIVVEPPPLPMTSPAALREIVAKALEKAPDDRYQSMRESSSICAG